MARGTTVAAVLAMQLLLVLPFGRSADAPVLVPEIRGHLERFPATVAKKLGLRDLKKATENFGLNAAGTMLVDPGIDRGFQLWAYEDPTQPSGVSAAVAEIDLATLEARRLLRIQDRALAIPGPGTVGVQFLATLDTKNHTLYFQTERGGGFVGAGTLRPEIVALDLRTFRHTVNELPPLIESGFGAATIFGMEFDEIGGNLVLTVPGLEGSPALTGNPVSVLGWPRGAFDGGPLPGGAGMLGPRTLRNCRRDPINAVGLNTDLSTPIMITTQPDAEANHELRTWVLIPCMTTPVSFNTAIVRLNHATLFDRSASDERLIPAPPGITNWAIDAKRGRFLLVNEAEGTDGWVYEASSNAYIGVIQIAGNPSGRSTGFGVDERSGRLYAFNQANGLMLAEMGQDPIPQADLYRTNPSVSGWPILLDARRDRIFVVPGTSVRSHQYEIYKVPPPQAAEGTVDPDSLTRQVKEEAGKTAAQYGGSATTYGVRTLLAGGFAGIVPTSGNDTAGRIVREINLRCGLRDREVVLASVQQTELQNSAREAKAAGVHLDNASVQDLGRPSRCDVYNELGLGFALLGVEAVVDSLQFSGLTGKMDETLPEPYPTQPEKGYGDAVDETLSPTTKWAYVPATCSKPIAEAGNNSENFAGPTSVSCDKAGVVEATSEARVRQDTVGSLVLSIGRAFTSTKVFLDGAKGLVSEATAIVENVKIGPVTIGYIENRARSYAKGRSGTARTDTYAPVIAGVRGPSITGCEVRCDLNAIIPALNTALAGRAEFRTLKPDAALLDGSPGGYQAGIIKSEKQRSSDNALVGDRSSEVPALEVIVYNDNPRLGRIRQLIQFAGVHVDSQYGIEVFGEGEPCFDCGIIPPIDDGAGPVVSPSLPPTPPVVKVLPKIIRRTVGGVTKGFQFFIANPRQAGVAATVWGLLVGPYLVWRRRRLLLKLGN